GRRRELHFFLARLDRGLRVDQLLHRQRLLGGQVAPQELVPAAAEQALLLEAADHEILAGGAAEGVVVERDGRAGELAVRAGRRLLGRGDELARGLRLRAGDETLEIAVGRRGGRALQAIVEEAPAAGAAEGEEHHVRSGDTRPQDELAAAEEKLI